MKGTEMRNRKAKKKWPLAFDESGAVAVISALIFATVAGVLGLALDFGHYHKVQADLQRTADAGALAGVTGLIPYNVSVPGTPGSDPSTPNWVSGQAAANIIISRNENKVDAPAITPTATVDAGYWYLKAPTGTPQTLPQARPTTSAWLPEPAIKVTLSKDVTMYLAPLIGFSGPLKATATATAILPETYGISGVPPIAVAVDTVYDLTPGAPIKIDVVEQTIKPQSQKGLAGWINLSGENSVPSVRFAVPLIASPTGVLTNSKVYFTPGTEATLMNLVSVGETMILPVVQDVTAKEWANIITWSAFKIDSLSANSMTGHFVEIGYLPNQTPDERPAGYPATPFVWGTPKIVSP